MSVLWSYIKEVWKFFSSVKLSIFLLLSLAGTSIIGTLIPQNAHVEEYLRVFGEFKYRIFDIFDFFDLYHSWWFQLLIILLTVNIIVCSYDRLSATWKIIFNRNPSFKPAQFKNAAYKEDFIEQRSIEQIRGIYEQVVRKTFSYVRLENSSTGFFLYAEKQRWSRLGVYIVHLSIVLLLLGSLIGSIFGFDGFVNIPEGESVSRVQLNNTNKIRTLDFEIRCDDFDVSFYNTGAPKEFRSRLTILENGKPVLQKDIIVNDPLRYKGINIFQSSYGQLPTKDITLNINVIESGMVYQKKAVIGLPVELPEGMGTLVLKNYTKSAEFRGAALGEAFMGILSRKSEKPEHIVLPLRFSNFDRMRKDKVVISVAEQGGRYYTGLQVTGDPGVWVVYSGFIIIILGCIITFFMSHQRVCVEVVQKGQSITVTVLGKANKNNFGMQKVISKITKRLTE